MKRTLTLSILLSFTYSLVGEITILECEYTDSASYWPPETTSGTWNGRTETFSNRCEELLFWNWAGNEGRKVDEGICEIKDSVRIYFDEEKNYFNFSPYKMSAVENKTKIEECFDVDDVNQASVEMCKYRVERFGFNENEIFYINSLTYDYKHCAEKAAKGDYVFFDDDCLSSGMNEQYYFYRNINIDRNFGEITHRYFRKQFSFENGKVNGKLIDGNSNPYSNREAKGFCKKVDKQF